MEIEKRGSEGKKRERRRTLTNERSSGSPRRVSVTNTKRGFPVLRSPAVEGEEKKYWTQRPIHLSHTITVRQVKF